MSIVGHGLLELLAYYKLLRPVYWLFLTHKSFITNDKYTVSLQ